MCRRLELLLQSTLVVHLTLHLRLLPAVCVQVELVEQGCHLALASAGTSGARLGLSCVAPSLLLPVYQHRLALEHTLVLGLVDLSRGDGWGDAHLLQRATALEEPLLGLGGV